MGIITGRTKFLALIGYPITHSLSPIIHNLWLEKRSIDVVYTALKLSPENLQSGVKSLSDLGFLGLNVTMPHKEKILISCTEISETAKRIGAVNTIIFKEGKIIGKNTDKEGFLYGLSENDVDILKLSTACLLGAGGAARAIACALLDAGIENLFLVNRNVEQAKAFAHHIGASKKIRIIEWQKMNDVLPEAEIIINATPIGLNGKGIIPMDFDTLNRKTVFYDSIYYPLETAWLKQAKKRNHTTIDGLSMLIGQAAISFSHWFNQAPPESSEVRLFLRNHIQEMDKK